MGSKKTPKKSTSVSTSAKYKVSVGQRILIAVAICATFGVLSALIFMTVHYG